MHTVASNSLDEASVRYKNEDIAASFAEKGQSLEIVALDDTACREAADILMARHLRNNPVRALGRTIQCKEDDLAAVGSQKKEEASFFMRMAQKHFPPLDWVPKINRKTLQADVIAGLTVGVMVIPQGMSYANIAGLEYIYGLYSACVPTFIYGLFGQSRQLAVGPVAMVSLLVEAGLRGALPEDKCHVSGAAQYKECPDEYAKLAFLCAAVVGLMQIVASILKLGFMVSFLGHPVVSGFTSGAAIIIGLSQVKYIFGFDIKKSEYVYVTIGEIFSKLGETKYMCVILGLLCLAFLMTLKKLTGLIDKETGKKKYPRLAMFAPMGPLIACLVGTLLVWLIKPLQEGDSAVGYLKDIPGGIFPLSIQHWDFGSIGAILPTALTSCLIGYMESIAIGKNLAMKNKYEIDPGQEMLALGVANLVGACFSCYPVTGSFSRSAVNNSTGGKTQLSGLITSLVMFFTLMFLTPLFYYLPKFVLAAVVINSVIPLVAYQEAISLFRVKKQDCLLWFVACLGTLFLGVLMGILIAVGLSLVIVISESVRPQISILWRIPGTTIYRNMKQEPSGSLVPNVFIVRIGSSMYFANASFIKDMLLAYISDLEDINNTEYIVLEMTAVVSIDSSAVHLLHDLVTDFRSRGIEVAFAMVGNRVEKTMKKAALKKYVGDQWFFHTVNEAVLYCLKHQHCKRKKQQNADQETPPDAPLAMTNLTTEEQADIHNSEVGPSNEVGFSNEMHPMWTMVFITMSKDAPATMNGITCVFKKNDIDVMRAQVEQIDGGGAKHVYHIRSIRTGGKLANHEVDRVREGLAKVMSSDRMLGSIQEDDSRVSYLEQELSKQVTQSKNFEKALEDQKRRIDELLEAGPIGGDQPRSRQESTASVTL